MKKSDMMIGLYILAAIVFLIIPIPTQLLDVLMALNISVSLIIMFNALFFQRSTGSFYLPVYFTFYYSVPNIPERFFHKKHFNKGLCRWCRSSLW